MINPYHQRIDIDQILELQAHQYQQSLYLEVEVEANSSVDGIVNVTSLGHFMNLHITGDYSTATSESADDDICRLRGQLIDGANNRELWTNPIPLNIVLSPGRAQSIAAAGSVSNQLYLVFPFVYTFPLNGQIIMRLFNDGDYVNRARFVFTGIRIFPAVRQTM
jgi:hypothetical protein